MLLAWKAAVADAVAKGWTREETVARVRFDDAFGPVDVGQGYMMDHIQTKNAGSLWDKLTAVGLRKGREPGPRSVGHGAGAAAAALCAPGRGLVLAGAAGEPDEVLVELEPDRRGSCRRGVRPRSAGRRLGLLERSAEADAVVGQRGQPFVRRSQAIASRVERHEAVEDAAVVGLIRVVVDDLARRGRGAARR